MFQGNFNKGSFFERSFFIVFLFISFFHIFFFDSPILLIPFSAFLFCSSHFIFQWGELDIFWNSNFSYLPSSIRHLIVYNPLEKSFFVFAPSVGVILGRVIERNYQAQRGDYRIIFYISEGMMKDGHFSFQT